MWRTEVKTTACSGDSLWGPGGAVRERGGLVRVEETPAPRPPLVMGLGRPSPSFPKMPARIGCK